MFFRFLISVNLLVVVACTRLPEYENRLTGGVTPRDVTEAIECELFAALPIWKAARKDQIVKGQLVAVADLTLQVDEQATLTPSFTHTAAISPAFSRIFNWGLKLDTQATRTYSESVFYRLDPDKLRASDGRCKSRDGRRQSIVSDLGLAEAVTRGLQSETIHGEFAKSNTAVDKGKAAFGQTVNFVVAMNVSGMGPTWNMTSFKGPGSMLLAQRSDTHKVIISFVDLVQQESKPSKTERYLESICRALKGADCPTATEKKADARFAATLTVRQEVDQQALQNAINLARENNAILRLQGLGTLGPLP
ncbi:MAG: hypothetical protein NW223_24830 [Hyphomicrobiaceae bacterium]|nr:hypothetical protein [Hyphomicrobiaceae bacterium]